MNNYDDCMAKISSWMHEGDGPCYEDSLVALQ